MMPSTCLSISVLEVVATSRSGRSPVLHRNTEKPCSQAVSSTPTMSGRTKSPPVRPAAVDHADGEGVAPAQAAGDGVGAVVELADRRVDPGLRVSSPIRVEPLITLDTVEGATPASLATSLMVTDVPPWCFMVGLLRNRFPIASPNRTVKLDSRLENPHGTQDKCHLGLSGSKTGCEIDFLNKIAREPRDPDQRIGSERGSVLLLPSPVDHRVQFAVGQLSRSSCRPGRPGRRSPGSGCSSSSTRVPSG